MDRPPFDTMLYRSPLLQVASFRAEPDQPRFNDSGPTENHIFVFPRTSCIIQHAGKAPFLAGPSCVNFYNQGQVYTREAVAGEGDYCEWFAIEPGVLREVVGSFDPSVSDHPDRPFRFDFGPSDPRSYLLQRLLVRHLTGEERPDPLFVEETALRVFARVATSAAKAAGMTPALPSPEAGSRHRDLAEAAKIVLQRQFREALSLPEVARETGASVFHLSRVFRRQTGMTLHAYQAHLRLITALEVVAVPEVDLTGVALDLGFSSHSHFTAAFRKAFGVTPSAIRQAASARKLRELAAQIEGGGSAR
ncbi:MAG TPA: AraC family transcriptional regulator [Thermoanaerobaculia bacterium]|nr:AraC family transcriptional regulator [Thermoanaerobaculia bacterium]